MVEKQWQIYGFCNLQFAGHKALNSRNRVSLVTFLPKVIFSILEL